MDWSIIVLTRASVKVLGLGCSTVGSSGINLTSGIVFIWRDVNTKIISAKRLIHRAVNAIDRG